MFDHTSEPVSIESALRHVAISFIIIFGAMLVELVERALGTIPILPRTIILILEFSVLLGAVYQLLVMLRTCLEVLDSVSSLRIGYITMKLIGLGIVVSIIPIGVVTGMIYYDVQVPTVLKEFVPKQLIDETPKESPKQTPTETPNEALMEIAEELRHSDFPIMTKTGETFDSETMSQNLSIFWLALSVILLLSWITYGTTLYANKRRRTSSLTPPWP